MRKNSIYLLMILLIIHGCAYSVPQINSSRGTVKVGMSKEDVFAVWGKPYHKWLQEQSLESDMWLYPGKHWWGANQVLLRFNENDILEEIELVQD